MTYNIVNKKVVINPEHSNKLNRISLFVTYH
jgi:hypothetical protein